MSKKKKFNLRNEWKNNKENVKWLVKLGRGFRKYVLGFLLINFVSMTITLLSSIAGKQVVDSATGFGTGNFGMHIILMATATLVTILLAFFSTLFSSYVGEKFAFSIRAGMFDKVQRSRWFSASRFHSGDMLSRLTSDINSISGAIISVVPTIVIAGIEFMVVLAILLYYDPTMAFIGLVVGPLGVIAGAMFRRRFVRYQKRLRESESEYYSFFQETLSNLTVTKAFQLEDENNEKFSQLRKRRLKLIMKSSRLSAFMHIVVKIIYNMGYVAAFSWCAYRLANPDDNYTYGTMTLFLSLVAALQNTIKSMGGIIPLMFSTLVSAGRVREITEIAPEESTGRTDIPASVGLRFKDVCFTYEKEEVLHKINLNIAPGRRVGVVGSSGAGKTTFIRLLLALIEADSGETVFIVDNEEEKISSDSRRFISFVPQGNTLMSGSIRSNLLTGNKNASEDELWAALEMAQAADFVRKSPDGLDMVLSENAGGLSEGQAQRIAIARALLRNRPVLILDEAASALDEATEKKIFKRLCSETDKTCFIITHRRSMLEYCDVILEIGDGGRAVVIDKSKSEK